MNLKYFVDTNLNYGRHHIHKFLSQVGPLNSVLDIGAGHGDDLMFARKINPLVKLYAIDVSSPKSGVS